MATVYKIHPAIGFARLGTSAEVLPATVGVDKNGSGGTHPEAWPGLLQRFPNFYNDVQQQNWHQADSECHRLGVPDERNDAIKQRFDNAAASPAAHPQLPFAATQLASALRAAERPMGAPSIAAPLSRVADSPWCARLGVTYAFG